LAGVYFALGVVGATWFSRIPTEQLRLHLGTGRLGLALLGPPVGSVAASLALPRLLHRWGAVRMVRVALVACGGTLALLPLPRSLFGLLGALLLFGVASGGLDVAMNANALSLQHMMGRSVFGRLHAMWSLGGFAASGLAALLVHAGVRVTADLVATGIVVAVMAYPVTAGLRGAPDAAARSGRGMWSRHPAVLVFAVVALAAFVVEVAAADWGGVFLARDDGASAGLAAGAYAAFSLPHFLARISGDPIVDRFGRRRLLVIGLVVAAAGFVLLVASPAAGIGVAGLSIAGLGVALVVPVAFSSAGAVPGVPGSAGLATAAGMGYVGWTAAPPVIGGLGSVAGLRVGMSLPILLAVVGIVGLLRRGSWETGL